MKINFGPSGLGSVNEAIENLKMYLELGLSACEIPFTYNIYIKKEDAIKIGEFAKKNKIKLSIHAPYFVNLNSEEKIKVENSKKRILKCCEIGHYLGAKNIVFHAGFYSKKSKEETFQNIKDNIIELQKEIKKNNWNVFLCPEIMGKINVFGSIEEISRLTKETNCSFTIDFAHILARYKEDRFEELKKAFPQKKWHCHFSGIEYTEKGEKNHILTSEKKWEELLKELKKIDKEYTIINESPSPIEDSVKGLKIFKEKF
ncbi:MAG: TIM barrel protein [Candidatus Pacearchaeota archaeon]